MHTPIIVASALVSAALLVASCHTLSSEASSQFAQNHQCTEAVVVGPPHKVTSRGTSCNNAELHGGDDCEFYETKGCGQSALFFCQEDTTRHGASYPACNEVWMNTYVATDGTSFLGTESVFHVDQDAVQKAKLASAVHDLQCKPDAIATVSDTTFAGCGQLVTYASTTEDANHVVRFTLTKKIPLAAATPTAP